MIKMSDTQTATVDADEFARAVANAALFATTDDTLPSLCTVHMAQGIDGCLLFEATNRYVASQEQVPMTDREHDPDHPDHGKCPPPVTSLDVLADAKDLARAAKMIKQVINPATRYSAPADQPCVVISKTDGEDYVKLTLTGNLAPDSTFTAAAVDGAFPDRISQFFDQHRKPAKPVPGMETPEPGPVPVDWSVAVKWLTLITKVDDGDPPKHRTADFSFAAQAGKPMVVTVGERFRALVMPWQKP